MSTLQRFILPIAISIFFFYFCSFFSKTKINVPQEGYFGSGEFKNDNTLIKPFKIHVDQQIIDDLKLRLKNHRVSHLPLEDSDNAYYGMNSKHLLKVRDYWLNDYNWRKYEAILNEFSQFTTEIEGLRVHFLNIKPPQGTYKVVKPLLISHGWPGSIFEFYKFAPILTDPKKYGLDSEFAFEVVAPSIPGFGWSEQPKKTGFSQLACARVFKKLMVRLGFEKFYLQGGDWGAVITSLLARAWPEHVLGLHLNLILIPPGHNFMATFYEIVASFFPSILSSPSLSKDFNFFWKYKILTIEGGYFHIQATKPDTIGTCLNESPLALAAYIFEQIPTWTNWRDQGRQDGGLNRKFSNDELLTMIMIYWVNENIVSSVRFYREQFLDPNIDPLLRQYIALPCGHASGLNEIYDRTPIEASRQLCNITHYKEIEMGHFAALEQPMELAKSVFEFVKEL